MKKYKLILIILSVFLASSCQDLLEETPIDSISSDYIYSSKEGLTSGLNGLYNDFRSLYYPGGTSGGILSQATFRIANDLGHGRIATNTAYHPYFWSPQGRTPGYWNTYYSMIDKANGLVYFGEDVDMDQDEKDLILAQVRVIRAIIYKELLTTYGNIVFKDTPTTIANIDDIDYTTPADPAVVWQFIDDDLDFAVSKLPWVVSPGEIGQGVARHVRGESALWQEDWQEAADQFDAIVNNGTHHLVDLDKVFTGDRNHAESLLTFQFSEELGGTDNQAGGAPSIFGLFFAARYYELSGAVMIPDTKYGGQTYGWSYPNDYLQSLYDQENDQRYLTYYWDMNGFVINNPDNANYGQPLLVSDISDADKDNVRRWHWSIKKFHSETIPATSGDGDWVNFIHYRFAETLLFGAEAHWRLSGSSTDAKALEYINLIRRRAYGDNDHDYTSIDLDSYLEEHAREMALEHSRWWVLKRLGVLTERVNLYFTIGGSNSNQSHVSMEKYMEDLPIPQSQIELMRTFPQNPGYN